jgi:hypothetical protein
MYFTLRSEFSQSCWCWIAGRKKLVKFVIVAESAETGRQPFEYFYLQTE